MNYFRHAFYYIFDQYFYRKILWPNLQNLSLRRGPREGNKTTAQNELLPPVLGTAAEVIRAEIIHSASRKYLCYHIQGVPQVSANT